MHGEPILVVTCDLSAFSASLKACKVRPQYRTLFLTIMKELTVKMCFLMVQVTILCSKMENFSNLLQKNQFLGNYIEGIFQA